MGLFRQKKATGLSGTRATTVADPAGELATIDTFYGDGTLERAHRSLQQGHWGDAEALLHERGNCSRTMRALSRSDVSLGVIEAWHEATPSARTLTLLANALIGYGRSLDDHGEATGAIRRAETLLRAGISKDPTCPEPWALLQTTGTHLRLDHDELQRRFDQAHALAPFHTAAVRARVQALSPRNGGSTIGLREFCRWLVEEAPQACPALGAIVEAQYEIALDRSAGEGTPPLSLMNSVDNIRQAQDAFAEMLEGVRDTAPIAMVEPLNWLLFWVGATDPRSADLNRRGFDALKNRIAAEPWNMTGPGKDRPVLAFHKARRHRLRMCDQIGAIYQPSAAATLPAGYAHMSPSAQRVADAHLNLEQTS